MYFEVDMLFVNKFSWFILLLKSGVSSMKLGQADKFLKFYSIICLYVCEEKLVFFFFSHELCTWGRLKKGLAQTLLRASKKKKNEKEKRKQKEKEKE